MELDISWKDASAASGLAVTTMSQATLNSCLRRNSCSLRLRRLRTTAPPTRLLIENPNLDESPSVRTAATAKSGSETRRPLAITVRNSLCSRSRLLRVSPITEYPMLASDGQLHPAACAAAGDNLPSVPRAHARTEAVDARASALLGLICPECLCHRLSQSRNCMNH